MRTRTRIGQSNYAAKPVPISCRQGWEFQVCLRQQIAATLPGGIPRDEAMQSRTLWVFPPTQAHGWLSDGPVERAVFDYNEVPRELEELVPARGYYRIALSTADCHRLRQLAETAIAMDAAPTELAALHDQGLLIELSVMALREVEARPLAYRFRARRKVEEAVGWYDRHMTDDPNVDQIAHAVSISTTHLRRLCHQVRDASPHQIFHRLRMQRVGELLKDHALTLDDVALQVGFSSSSALSRAVKNHFGSSPRQLRQCELV